MSTAHDEILPLHFVQSQNEGSGKYIENTPTPQLSEDPCKKRLKRQMF